MGVQKGTKFVIPDSEIPNNSIGQYMFYGRGGGYGHMKIINASGRLLAEQIIQLGPNDTYAKSTTTGHFELSEGDLTIHLSYSSSCSCDFGSRGEIYSDTSKVVTPDSERFVASVVYGAYDLQGNHDYDDAVISITFTKK